MKKVDLTRRPLLSGFCANFMSAAPMPIPINEPLSGTSARPIFHVHAVLGPNALLLPINDLAKKLMEPELGIALLKDQQEGNGPTDLQR